MSLKENLEFNKRKEVIRYANQLERDFDRYRIFGDNRDFTEIKVRHRHKTQSKILCVIHKISPRLRPDLASAIDNCITHCEYCVMDYIKAFKKHRTQNNLPESNY